MNNKIVKGLILIIILLMVVFLFRIITQSSNSFVNETNQIMTNSIDANTNVISNKILNANTIDNTNSIIENTQQNTIQSNTKSNTQSNNVNANVISNNSNKNTNTVQNDTNNNTNATSTNSNNNASSSINKKLFSELDFSEFSQKKYVNKNGTKKVQACIYRSGKVELYFYNVVADTDYLIDYMEGTWNSLRKTIHFENTYTSFDMSVTSATNEVLKFNIKNYNSNKYLDDITYELNIVKEQD